MLRAQHRPLSFQAWVVYFDIYGFSALVACRGPDTIQKTLLRCATAIRSCTSTAKRYILSDSAFLVYRVGRAKNKDEVLRTCISELQQLLAFYAEEGFPLRGGVAFGQVSCDDRLLIGDAVARAVSYEKLIRAPFLLLPEREIDRSVVNPFLPRPRLVRLRNGGTMSAIVVVPRPLDGMIKLAAANLEQYSLTGPFDIATAWLSTLRLLEEIHRETRDE